MKAAERTRTFAAWLIAGAFAAALACNGSKLDAPSGPDPDPSAPTEAGDPDPDPDAGPGDDAAPPPFDDGKATRLACTSTLGTALTPPTHGRLDGQLVAIIGPKERRCPSDAQHLHLQVLMKAAVYDIAVNLDVFEGETDAKLPGAPFAEGWHPMDLDYVTDFGLHAAAMTVTSPDAVRQRVELALTNANHISVFGFAYEGSDGVHLIHRSSAGNDGALVINPLAPKAHVLAFRFVNNAF